MSVINARARHQARQKLLQALYQWRLVAADIPAILAEHLSNMNAKKVDVEYFNDTFQLITQHVDKLDAILIPYLDRTFEELDAISVSILRIATCELMFRLEIPYAIILDEALRLAKTFGASDSYKFINGVLDKVANELRQHEVAARQPRE